MNQHVEETKPQAAGDTTPINQRNQKKVLFFCPIGSQILKEYVLFRRETQILNLLLMNTGSSTDHRMLDRLNNEEAVVVLTVEAVEDVLTGS
jgi:hypothetical protein